MDQKLDFWVWRLFSGMGLFFSLSAWGSKNSFRPSTPRENKRFGRDILENCQDILDLGVLQKESLRQKACVQCRPLAQLQWGMPANPDFWGEFLFFPSPLVHPQAHMLCLLSSMQALIG